MRQTQNWKRVSEVRQARYEITYPGVGEAVQVRSQVGEGWARASAVQSIGTGNDGADRTNNLRCDKCPGNTVKDVSDVFGGGKDEARNLLCSDHCLKKQHANTDTLDLERVLASRSALIPKSIKTYQVKETKPEPQASRKHRGGDRTTSPRHVHAEH